MINLNLRYEISDTKKNKTAFNFEKLCIKHIVQCFECNRNFFRGFEIRTYAFIHTYILFDLFTVHDSLMSFR